MKKTTHFASAFLVLTLALLLILSSCSGADLKDGGNAGAPEMGPPSYNAPTMDSPEATPDNGEPSLDGTVFVENPFIATAENNISTFSADVDTASYSYFRKLANAGYSLAELKKHAAAFRTEEFINYFDYAANRPTEGELFGLTADILPTPWNASTVLLRMTLQAEEAILPTGNNLVFLIDVSGSMNSKDKLPLLKQAFSNLVGNLTANDTVSIVTYSGKEKIVLEGCPGNQDERIMKAINSLKASGSTNGEAGLSMAYGIAEKYMIEGGNNRIIIASDGDLNVGISSPDELKSFVESKRNSGIYLSVLGFGTGNYRDGNMEALADNGNGIYYYIDGETEAAKVFGDDLLGTLYTVAEDVKMQLTFDPAFVSSYRLIGYENRILSTEDFEDDTRDAGEVGAGHQVTVCYELTLADGARASESAWMSLAVRYKNPGEEISLLNEYAIGTSSLRDAANEDIAFLSSVIEFTMLLHNSKYSQDTTLASILENLNSLTLSDPLRIEFRTLVQNIAA